MQRMRRAAFDGAHRRDQRLPDHLSAEHALPAILRREAAKQVHLELFEVEHIEHRFDGSFGHGGLGRGRVEQRQPPIRESQGKARKQNRPRMGPVWIVVCRSTSSRRRGAPWRSRPQVAPFSLAVATTAAPTHSALTMISSALQLPAAEWPPSRRAASSAAPANTGGVRVGRPDPAALRDLAGRYRPLPPRRLAALQVRVRLRPRRDLQDPLLRPVPAGLVRPSRPRRRRLRAAPDRPLPRRRRRVRLDRPVPRDPHRPLRRLHLSALAGLRTPANPADRRVPNTPPTSGRPSTPTEVACFPPSGCRAVLPRCAALVCHAPRRKLT